MDDNAAIFLTGSPAFLWQFAGAYLDESTIYMVRPQQYGSYVNGGKYCMNARPTVPVLDRCDDSSVAWTVEPNEEYDVLGGPNSGYISYVPGTAQTNITQPIDIPNAQWSFSSVSAIDDQQWSSVSIMLAAFSQNLRQANRFSRRSFHQVPQVP